MKRILLAGIFGLAVFSIAFPRADALAGEIQGYVLIARKLCDLQDVRLIESSGLAASRRYAKADLLWTHNDSGGEPKLFLINLQGETVAEVTLEGAANIDWEDIAVAQADDGKESWIYIGDIGDNLRRRESITIYRLREPQLDTTKTGQVLKAPCETLTLEYPDGAHDSETLIVAKGESNLFILSKNGGASLIYKTPLRFFDGGKQTLEQIGEYSFTGPTARSYLATGGSVSSDGRHLIVRTYTHAYEWKIPIKGVWRDIWKATPRIFELPPSKQGESICYSADGRKFFTTSEGVPAPLFEIENED